MKPGKPILSPLKPLWLIAVAILLSGALAGGEAFASPNLFRSSEKESGDLKSFPKWLGMLARNGNAASGCSASVPCNPERLEKFIATLKGLAPMEQLKRVNQYHNQSPYIQDITNWGVNDYWETPGEFLGRHGDCEDYAIVKYFTLKRLGFEPSKMRIVVSQDMNLRVMHSILAVYMNGTIYILDNQMPSVVEHSKIFHYRPIYSINEHAWWRHM